MAILALRSFPDTPLPERQQAMSASTVGREFSEFLDDAAQPPRQVAAGNTTSSKRAVSPGRNDNVSASATVSVPASSRRAPAQSSPDDQHLVHVPSPGQDFSGDDVAGTARQPVGKGTEAAIGAQAGQTLAAADERAFLHAHPRFVEYAAAAEPAKPRSSKAATIADEGAEPDAAAVVPRSAVATYALPASTKTSAFQTSTRSSAHETITRVSKDAVNIASDASKTSGAERVYVEGGHAASQGTQALARLRATVPRSAVAPYALPASAKSFAHETITRVTKDDVNIASDVSKTSAAERIYIEGEHAASQGTEALARGRASAVEGTAVSRSVSPPAGDEVSGESPSHQLANGSPVLAWRHGAEWSPGLAVVPEQLPVAQRIFDFTSLGMFGAPTADGDAAMAVASGVGSAKTGAAEDENDEPAAISESVAADSAAAVAALSGSLSTALSAPASDDDAVTSADRPGAAPSRGALINPSASLVEMAAGESDDEGAPAETSVGLPSPVAPEKREIPSVNLVVAGPNDGLMVAARGAGETGMDVVTLRQMLDAVAAEFDMHIGEFHWNGSPAQNSANRGRNG